MNFLDQIVAALAQPQSVAIGLFIWEAVSRFVPTDKPAGVLHIISGVLGEAAKVSAAVASYLDKVLPQNVTAPAAAPAPSAPAQS